MRLLAGRSRLCFRVKHLFIGMCERCLSAQGRLRFGMQYACGFCVRATVSPLSSLCVCVWVSENAGAVHTFTLERRKSSPLAAKAVHVSVATLQVKKKKHSFGPFCEQVCHGYCEVELLYQQSRRRPQVMLQSGEFEKTLCPSVALSEVTWQLN